MSLHNGTTPLQLSHPGGRNPASVACMETMSNSKNFKLPFNNTPLTNDIKNYPFKLRSILGVLLARIQFHKIVRVPKKPFLSTHMIKFIIISPNYYRISLDFTDSEFIQIQIRLGILGYHKKFFWPKSFSVGFFIMKKPTHCNIYQFNHHSSLSDKFRKKQANEGMKQYLYRRTTGILVSHILLVFSSRFLNWTVLPLKFHGLISLFLNFQTSRSRIVIVSSSYWRSFPNTIQSHLMM